MDSIRTLNEVDEANLKMLGDILRSLNEIINKIHGCECEMVTLVQQNSNNVSIITNLEPEITAPILWQGLASVQAILKLQQPPTLTKQ